MLPYMQYFISYFISCFISAYCGEVCEPWSILNKPNHYAVFQVLYLVEMFYDCSTVTSVSLYHRETLRTFTGKLLVVFRYHPLIQFNGLVTIGELCRCQMFYSFDFHFVNISCRISM